VDAGPNRKSWWSACGAIGLPAAVAFASRGRRVVGYDIDAKKIGALTKGRHQLWWTRASGRPSAAALVTERCASCNTCRTQERRRAQRLHPLRADPGLGRPRVRRATAERGHVGGGRRRAFVAT